MIEQFSLPSILLALAGLMTTAPALAQGQALPAVLDGDTIVSGRVEVTTLTVRPGPRAPR